MKYQKRTKSIITKKKDLQHIFTFKKFPIFIGCTNSPKENDILFDMSFSICKKSGIIQLDKLIPLDILYSEYHSEATGKLWKKHHDEFVKFLTKFSKKKILEIGGSNCYIAKSFISKNKNKNWTIVEPNPISEKKSKIKIIKSIFDDKFKTKSSFDTIVHSHVIEHLHDPDLFLKKINSLLEIGDLHIFSIPNLLEYLKRKYSNCLNFEHTIFLTEYFIEYLLAKNGLEILEKKYFNEHSIFYATKKIELRSKIKLESKYKEYFKLFKEYVRYNKELVKKINNKIKNKSNVFLFGAHVFSQLLLNLGLHKDNIKFILDNSKIKQNKRLYGTNIFIKSPYYIKGLLKPVVILRAGSYQKEIMDQLIKINSSIKFIE